MMKGRVGKFEYWLVGKMRWEVRYAGVVVATAQNLSDASNAAIRLHTMEKAGL